MRLKKADSRSWNLGSGLSWIPKKNHESRHCLWPYCVLRGLYLWLPDTSDPELPSWGELKSWVIRERENGKYGVTWVWGWGRCQSKSQFSFSPIEFGKLIKPLRSQVPHLRSPQGVLGKVTMQAPYLFSPMTFKTRHLRRDLEMLTPVSVSNWTPLGAVPANT